MKKVWMAKQENTCCTPTKKSFKTQEDAWIESPVKQTKVLTPKKLQQKKAIYQAKHSPANSFDKVSISTAETQMPSAYTQYRVKPQKMERKVVQTCGSPFSQTEPDLFGDQDTQLRKRYNVPILRSETKPAFFMKQKKLQHERNIKHSFRNQTNSHYGFSRVFGTSGKDFFADCEDSCPCLEVIFGMPDCEMKDESVEISSLSAFGSDNPKVRRHDEIVRMDKEHEMVISVEENDTPCFDETASKEQGETHSNFTSYNSAVEDLEEPVNGYDIEDDKVTDNSLVNYNKTPSNFSRVSQW